MRFGLYLLAIVLFAFHAYASKEDGAPAVGDKAPDFTLKDADDQASFLKEAARKDCISDSRQQKNSERGRQVGGGISERLWRS